MIYGDYLQVTEGRNWCQHTPTYSGPPPPYLPMGVVRRSCRDRSVVRPAPV